MDAGVYPQPEVEQLVNRNFIPVKVNVLTDDTKQIAFLHNPWTPGFYVFEGEREFLKTFGYLPAADFAAKLQIALGNRALALGRAGEAAGMFHQAAETDNVFVPEALYWEGVARYKEDGNFAAAASLWKQLGDEYPKSEWAHRTSFIKEKAA
jgi:hypothetical protein